MKKLVIIFCIAVMCAACGSSPVDSSIRQVEKALERVEKNKDTMTKADWEALGKEIEEPLTVINAALEGDQIGVVGEVKVVMLVTKITTLMAEAGVQMLEQETGVKSEELMDAIKEAAEQQ
jgi:16S rRNA U1498 N3-methylase RsmE